VDQLLDSQDGVITRAQALRYVSAKTIRQRLATARWQEPHRSVFVTHNGPLGPAEKRWVALLTVGNEAVLAGLTALQAAGLRGYDDDAVHLLVPARHQPARAPAGIVVHRTTVFPVKDVLVAGRPPRTTAARSVVDAAQWAEGDDKAGSVVAAAFQQRLVVGQDVDDVLTRLRRARRRQLVVAKAREAEFRPHSLGEVDIDRLCARYRIPGPSRQLVRRDAAGRPRYFALLFAPWRLHVEIYAGPPVDREQAWSDVRRLNELRIAGERVLQFPAGTVRHRPALVARQIRAALVTAGWRPAG
jgi:hypothetical protein